MTLPASGQISLSQIGSEIGKSAPHTLSSTPFRLLGGRKPGNSISFSNFYGKRYDDPSLKYNHQGFNGGTSGWLATGFRIYYTSTGIRIINAAMAYSDPASSNIPDSQWNAAISAGNYNDFTITPGNSIATTQLTYYTVLVEYDYTVATFSYDGDSTITINRPMYGSIYASFFYGYNYSIDIYTRAITITAGPYQ